MSNSTQCAPAVTPPPERAIRVASVTRNWVIGGDERRLWETSLAMAAIPGAVEQVIFVLNDESVLSESERARWAAMRDDYRRAGIEVVELGSGVDMRTPGDLWEVARLVRRLVVELRRRGVQVVDARMGLGGLVALPAARLARVPVATLTTYYTSLYDGPYRYPLGQASVAMSDAVISDAQATLDDFAGWRLSRRAELVRIRNGFTATPSTLERAAARAALGIPEHWQTVVGQVSWVVPRKGWEVFIDSAAEVVAVRPDVGFIGVGHVGEGGRDFLAGLERRVRDAGLADHLHLVSYPGPVADVHRAVDVFTHLSLKDSQPMAIHEAMAAGTPTVVSGLPGNVEVVTDGVTGLVVEPGSARAAAKAILELVDDPARAAELGAASRARFEAEHTPQVLARSHVELYRRLLAAVERSGFGPAARRPPGATRRVARAWARG